MEIYPTTLERYDDNQTDFVILQQLNPIFIVVRGWDYDGCDVTEIDYFNSLEDARDRFLEYKKDFEEDA